MFHRRRTGIPTSKSLCDGFLAILITTVGLLSGYFVNPGRNLIFHDDFYAFDNSAVT
jgi:hypothetical protein